MTTKIPVPRMCRLERLTDGKWVHVTDCSLLYPDRYPQRLAAKGKVGRATVLDGNLRPTGEVYTATLADCSFCGGTHPAPYDGTCLL